MITIRNHLGHEVATSCTLRGILDRTRKVCVQSVQINKLPEGGALLTVEWSDKTYCFAEFKDHGVCVNWCKSRRAFPEAIIH